MSAIREYLTCAERQSAAAENAIKTAAKRDGTQAIPGAVYYPTADIDAAIDLPEFERLAFAAKEQAKRDGLAAYLAPKLDEVRLAFYAIREAAEIAVDRKRLIGQQLFIRLEDAISTLDADSALIDDRRGSDLTPDCNGKTEATNDRENDTEKNSEKNPRPLDIHARACIRIHRADRGKTPMRDIVAGYCRDWRGPADQRPSESGTMRRLNDNPDAWKKSTNSKRRKTTKKRHAV